MRLGLGLRLRPPGAMLNPIAALFANGEQGWVYDPSNLSTLFQDAAGTTPVTAMEQPVGLQLDLSQGLVLGPTLVTNGDFATDTGWTKNFGTTISGGAANFDGVTSIAANATIIEPSTPITVVAGKTYAVTYTIVTSTTASISTLLGSVLGQIRSTPGTYTEYIRPVDTSTLKIVARATTGVRTGAIDNISVKELPGNHRYQTSPANRPVVSARVNLLTKTEDFSDAVWSLFGGPTKTGTSTATITFSANATSEVYQIIPTNSVASSYTFAVQVRAVTPNKKFRLRVSGTGAGSDRSADFTATADWQTFTFDRAAITTLTNSVSISNASTADAGSIEVRYPDLRVANIGVGLPAYQRVNTSTDYDTAGFPVYIKPNGSNQFMVTNSINFSATDKMTVWQGVRKLSDAVPGIIFELSTFSDGNNGSFFLAAPGNNAAAEYRWRVRGTAQTNAIATTFTSPITNALTGLGDISGDRATLRVNRTQMVQSTDDLGTGNFGNYPAYFYARAGSQYFLSGHDYGSICRGAASTAGEITSAETWINNRTKAY